MQGVVASSGLIEVVPGLMIWTLIAFGITFFVLRKYAFGPIQKTIDERRDRIRQAVEEADRARNEARELLEQNRAILSQARSESAEILAEARRVSDAQIERAKQEAEVERQRRIGGWSARCSTPRTSGGSSRRPSRASTSPRWRRAPPTESGRSGNR